MLLTLEAIKEIKHNHISAADQKPKSFFPHECYDICRLPCKLTSWLLINLYKILNLNTIQL